MKALTLRHAERRLPGGRVLRLGLYADDRGEPLLAVLAIGFEAGGVADLVDPRSEDRIVLPGAVLGVLGELVDELQAASAP